MKTSCAINFSKLGFMEKLTNPLLEWCGWEDFKRFPWSVIDHDHTLPTTHTGDCRHKSRCFQLLCRPGGVSGQWGRVRAWASAGWRPHEQPQAGVPPTGSPDTSCPRYPQLERQPWALSFLAKSLYANLQGKEVFSREWEEGGKEKHTSNEFLPLFPATEYHA